MKSGLALEAGEDLALEADERAMVGNRTSNSGRVFGARVHALFRIIPLILSMALSIPWLCAYSLAPGGGP